MTNNIFICCESGMYKFIGEYIMGITPLLKAKLILTDLLNPEYNNQDTYIFINKIPQKIMQIPLPHMYLVNVEQCTIQEYYNSLNDILIKNIQVIDYSNENIKILNNNSNMIHLPYQYNDSEVNILKEYIKNSEKQYDVAFVGHLSTKRQKIYDELVKKGIKMLHVNNKWGHDRDKSISQAKILLNIHFDETYNIYEPLRCDRWAFAGMPVISENSLHSDTLDINSLIVFGEYDHLVDQIVYNIHNYDQFHKEYLEIYNSHINQIKENRKNLAIELKNRIDNSYINVKKPVNTLVDNTLEIFSANWVCNYQKPSFIKIGKQVINLSRGYNLVGLKDKTLTILKYFDTCIEDFSVDIQKYVKEIYDKQEYDYLLIMTHDDAVCKTNPNILQNYLIFLGCQKLRQLQFRASYALVYDLKNRNIVYENCDNQCPIHEWFEITNNNLENLGMPVYLIVYNLLYFVKNSVEQLRKYTKNIHIIDNKSTYMPLLEYYDTEYEFFLDKMDANYGHLVWLRQMYWKFPRIFAMSDPDLQFNQNLPHNFLTIMENLTNEYKKGKVGFALDLSDSELFFKEQSYTEGISIEEWEKRFWLRKIDHQEYELYNAGVDTTFCVVNKAFEETHNAIRMGGDFTCKHIPWYEGWEKKLDENEWEFYKNNNISSSTVRMIMKIYNDTHKQSLSLFNDMNLLINQIDEIKAKIPQQYNLSNEDIIELQNNLITSHDYVMKNKLKLSHIIQNNIENA